MFIYYNQNDNSKNTVVNQLRLKDPVTSNYFRKNIQLRISLN